MIVSSTGGSSGSDEGSNTAKGLIIMAYITVCLLVAAFCCYRAGRREESQLSERRGAENGCLSCCLSWWQRQRRAWAEAQAAIDEAATRQAAARAYAGSADAPVAVAQGRVAGAVDEVEALPPWSRGVELNGGPVIEMEGPVRPCRTVSATTDADGSRRAWTVVTAESNRPLNPCTG